MNTPRTKPPKRFALKPAVRKAPGGGYEAGVHNDDFARKLGQLAATWPHVEDRIIGVFQALLGIDNILAARQVFRGIVNQQIRLQLMRDMLERAPRNAKRDDFYDEVLAEFASLNGLRNTYLHGLWFTHDDGRVLLSDAPDNFDPLSDARLVDLGDLDGALQRMLALSQRILVRETMDRRAARAAPPAS